VLREEAKSPSKLNLFPSDPRTESRHIPKNVQPFDSGEANGGTTFNASGSGGFHRDAPRKQRDPAL
jgi:hypothetical protein